MKIIEQLLQDVPIPRLVKVKQKFHAPEITDVASGVHQAISEADALSRISKGDQVAIAVGSRGVADIPILVREVANAVRSAGGQPFIVPAMGSHGGATAEGQREVLNDLGVTEAFVGAPIRSSMDVVQVGQLPNGLPVFVDKYAFEADKVIVINRIKPHTSFRGTVESGLMKMVTIGLGKQKGADAAHSYGLKYMAEHVLAMSKITLSHAPIIFGLGVVENAFDRPAKIVAVMAEDLERVEPDLLKEAKGLMPRLPFDSMDVLVVDEIGKDIAGTGMDPNITGRFTIDDITGGPEIGRIVALGLTKKAHGNAYGIGLADMTTRKVFDEVVWEKGFANSLTSTVLRPVKMPMFLETEDLAVKAAIKTSNIADLSQVRLVRIHNTLELEELWISESLVPEALERNIEILTQPAIPDFTKW